MYIPAGAYLLSNTVQVTSLLPLTVRGEGWVSNLLWAADADLLAWNTSQPLAHMFFADFAVSSISAAKSRTSTALRFTAGVTQSVFESLLFFGQGTIPGTGQATTLTGTNMNLGAVTDTVTVRDCVHWFTGGTGVVIGRGSEVRVLGGRIIGPANRYDGTIGVHVTGNNGGVHIVETDVIGLQTGVLLDDSNGAGSNREIFITHATMDSDGIGLYVDGRVRLNLARLLPLAWPRQECVAAARFSCFSPA